MKYHCEMIAAHLLELQREAAENAAQPLPAPEKKLTLCVEGNISAGKSSFLRMLTQDITLHEMVEVRHVPIVQMPCSIKCHAVSNEGHVVNAAPCTSCCS